MEELARGWKGASGARAHLKPDLEGREDINFGGESVKDLNAPALYERSSLFGGRLLLAWRLWGTGTEKK